MAVVKKALFIIRFLITLSVGQAAIAAVVDNNSYRAGIAVALVVWFNGRLSRNYNRIHCKNIRSHFLFAASVHRALVVEVLNGFWQYRGLFLTGVFPSGNRLKPTKLSQLE
jgi:hypothetical protein